jgi:hypothetical protein
METSRRASTTLELPREKDLKNDLRHFGFLHLLVVGMVTLAFIGKAAVSEWHPVSAPSSGAAMTANSYLHPGSYGRALR